MRFIVLPVALLGFTCCCSSVKAFVTPSTTSGSNSIVQRGGSRSFSFAYRSTFISSSAATALCSAQSDGAEGASASAATTNTQSSVVPAEPGTHDELMYALGVNLARQLGDVRPLVESSEELTMVAKGILDTIIGRFDEEEQRQLLKSRGQDLNALITERANNIRKRIEEAGRAMLKQMSETEGVMNLPSGVVVHVLEDGPEGPGQGVRPTAASTVRVHYHGTLPDGTVFDSTLNGDPVQFALGQVIPGWKEGLLKMHEGETAMLGIPPEQAYGMQGTPDGRIPGGATLFFKVQLLEVLTAGIGGSPTLLGSDGKKLKKNDGGSKSGGSGLLGPDGKPL